MCAASQVARALDDADLGGTAIPRLLLRQRLVLYDTKKILETAMQLGRHQRKYSCPPPLTGCV